MARLKTETAVFRVGIAVPNAANMKDCEDYIRTAIQEHSRLKLLEFEHRPKNVPDDFSLNRSPMLNLDASLVRVSLLERHTHYVDSGNHGGGRRKRVRSAA
jgi:hypothetical protein